MGADKKGRHAGQESVPVTIGGPVSFVQRARAALVRILSGQASKRQFGRYQIRARVGKGGMAEVYRAYDPLFEREVALKVLPAELGHTATFRARFGREAQTIAALEHPAIVPVYDIGESAGQPYLVMRHMTGGSLLDRLAHGPLSLPEASQIFTRIADALDETHAQGIVHRDLKPGNILFNAKGEAFLSDFGVAKLIESTTTLTGTDLVGTPAYMSPEQARGLRNLDGRSDVYSLGVILFHSLGGQLPFEAETPMGMALAHIHEAAPDIRSLNPHLPAGCQAILARALAKEPADRYATAGALARDLNTVAAAGGLAGMTEPLGSAAGRRSTLAPTPFDARPESRLQHLGNHANADAAAPSQPVRRRASATPPKVTAPAEAQPPRWRSAVPLVLFGAVGLGGLCLLLTAAGALLVFAGRGTATPTSSPSAIAQPTQPSTFTPTTTATRAPSLTPTASPSPTATATTTATNTLAPPTFVPPTVTAPPPPSETAIVASPVPTCSDPREIFDPFLNRCRINEDSPLLNENKDQDGDGYTPRQGDCDDLSPFYHPGADDPSGGPDYNCDGQA